MKFQAFVEQVDAQMVSLRIAGQQCQLPRTCFPPELEEADVLDVVVFVNEKETERQLSQLRRWLVACGLHRASELQTRLQGME